MSHKHQNQPQSSRDNQDKHSAAIRKSILRNPEIPIRSEAQSYETFESSLEQQRVRFNDDFNEYQKKTQDTGPHRYNEPRLNKVKELRKSLSEIHDYEGKHIEDMRDLSKKNQELVNRGMSAKLNFPAHQSVFKNLTKLEPDEKSPDVAHKLIQKSARKVAENSTMRKSLEVRNEIKDLINELVGLEFKESDIDLMTKKLQSLPSENDFLGLSKFSSPNILLPNKKFESQRYVESVQDSASLELFKVEEFLGFPKWQKPDMEVNNDPESNCKCLSEFYSLHSTCS